MRLSWLRGMAMLLLSIAFSHSAYADLTRRVNPNGDFSVRQRGLVIDSAPHDTPMADGYYSGHPTGNTVRAWKSNDVPLAASPVPLQSMCAENKTVVNQNPNLVGGIVFTGSSNSFFTHLKGREISRSFWFKSTVAGTYSYGIRSNGGPGAETSDDPTQWAFQTYSMSFSVPANTWVFVRGKTTVPPASFDFGAGGPERGFASFLFLGGGSNFHGVQNAWGPGATGVNPNQVNWYATQGAIACIAHDQIEASDWTPFERRTFAEERHDLMRFFQTSFPYGTRPAAGLSTQSNPFAVSQQYFPTTRVGADGYSGVQIPFTREMASRPSISIFNPIDASNPSTFFNWSAGGSRGGSLDNVSERGFRASVQDTTALSGNTILFGRTADASVPGPGRKAYR